MISEVGSLFWYGVCSYLKTCLMLFRHVGNQTDGETVKTMTGMEALIADSDGEWNE